MKPGYPHNGITTALFKPVAAALSIVALLAGCGSVEAKDSKTEIASIAGVRCIENANSRTGPQMAAQKAPRIGRNAPNRS